MQAVSAKGIQLADVSKGYITKEEHDNEIQKQETANQSEKRDHALDIAIMQAKGKNPKAIKALLDMEKITINEDGKVEGIDLSPIQKTDSYLFDTETVSTSGTGAGGMGKYDKDKGYAQGSVSLSYQTKTLTQDRGRTFQLDAMDVDETNFITAAGSVMGEFQRTKVIPEIDAYRYSTIAKLAISGSKTSDIWVSTKPAEAGA